jgi:hypothetical protein
VTGSAKMRMRESDDRAIVILISGAILIRVLVVLASNIVRLLVGIRRELNGSERHRRPRIRVTHLLRSDERVDVTNVIRRLPERGQVQTQKDRGQD